MASLTKIGGGHSTAASQTTLVAALTTDIQISDAAWVAIIANSSTVQSGNATDSQGQTWVLDSAVAASSTSIAIYRLLQSTKHLVAGTDTITITLAATMTRTAYTVVKLNGGGPVKALDKSVTAHGAALPATATTATLTQASEIALSVTGWHDTTSGGGGDTYATDTGHGWASADTENASSATANFYMGVDGQGTAATTALTSAPTIGGTAPIDWCEIIVTYTLGVINTVTSIATQASSASVQDKIGKALSVSEATSASVTKIAGKTLGATQASSATVTKQTAKTFGASQVSSATVLKQAGKVSAAAQASSASVVKMAGKVVGAFEALGVPSGFTKIGGGASTAANQSTMTVALTRDVGLGDAAWIAIIFNSSTAASGNATDSQGQSWILDQAVGASSTSIAVYRVFASSKHLVAGTDTITVTLPAAMSRTAYSVVKLLGGGPVTGLDQNVTNHGAALPAHQNTATLVQPNEVALSVTGWHDITSGGGGDTYATDTADGWAGLDTEAASLATANFYLGVDGQGVQSTAKITSAPTIGGTAPIDWCLIVLTYTLDSRATVVKAVSKTISVSEAAAGSVSKQIGKTFSASQPSSATVVKQVGKLIGAVQASVAILLTAAPTVFRWGVSRGGFTAGGTGGLDQSDSSSQDD